MRMPGRQSRVKPRGFGPWVDPDVLPPLPRPKKNRKPKQKKRFHHAFRVLIALGLIPTKSRQCDPLGLRLNRMHVMEGDCEKSSGCLTAEGAPELAKPVETTDAKTPVEANLINGDHREEEENHELIEKEEPKEEKKPSEEERSVNEEEPKEEENVTKEPKVEENQTESASAASEAEEKTSKPATPSASIADKEIKEEQPHAEEDDRNSISSSHVSQSEGERRKRSIEREGDGEVSSGSESESGRKKIKSEHEVEQNSMEASFGSQTYTDDERERMLQDFVSDCTTTPDDLDQTAEKLQREVETLAELARAKELEWNAILRVRKLKEEMLERVLRRKRISTLLDDPLSSKHMELSNNINKGIRSQGNQSQLMMVPIVSSSPGIMHSRNPPSTRNMPLPDYSRMQRPILPKPYPSMMDPGGIIREGRNGPILDVKSIIADYSGIYRNRHPENVPRRGRRLRSEGTPRLPPPHPASLISMANLALGSGSRVRTIPEAPYNLSQDHSHPTSTDSSRNPLDGFKEMVSHFNKMSSPSINKGAPPPYPEVTLHPVTRPNSPPSSSLLHGILTKAPPPPTNRPATFSPTLARLLTAPERPSNPGPPPHYRPQQTPRVSIADILTSSKQKSRNEITITPVAGGPPTKSKEDVVLLDDDDPESGDRLVIDEGAESEDVPQCQGCRQKSSQFVCAGCGNQWYCSRECQVTAWEEHSEVCSG